MSPERWQLVSDIFDEASQLADDDRGELLDRRCRNDRELRSEVESLLAHRRDSDSLFDDTPRRGVVNDERADFSDWIGRNLGPYQLKRLLSAGGMGVVFLAEQQNPRRDVAIKILHRGLLFGGARRRFEYEAQMLGRLRHPCVAEVFEAGHASLSPSPPNEPVAPMHFFAMEYVEGGHTLIEHARRRNLSLRARLRLFVRICDGVHHGHQKAVIHRDLKPANILVTDEEHADGTRTALPKIIDFGVAKCTDADVARTTMQTSAGELIGTLQYMSPEQCGADALAIDTRADVYALGVVLFELLTNRVPYDVSNHTIPSAVRIISETPPAAGSQFDRRLRGDLDVILRKALEKDRERRYGSAAELAGDIRRFLDGEPIDARRPSRMGRLIRWILRHPRISAVAASIALSLSILATTLVSIWLVNSRPYRIELTFKGDTNDAVTGHAIRNGDRATIFAFSGNELKSWNTLGDGIAIAALVDRPALWGGGKVAVVGFANHQDSVLNGRLCLFSTADLDRPVWTRTVDASLLDKLPNRFWPRPNDATRREYVSEGFEIRSGWVINIFDDQSHPGDEIVAYHQYERGTQGVLRIYNLNGDVLYQAWQDGGVVECCWLAGPRVLICAALKGDMYDYEYKWDIAGGTPRVLFALRPSAGEIQNAWIHPYHPGSLQRFDGDVWDADQVRPLWYRLACPIEWTQTKTAFITLTPASIQRFPGTDNLVVQFSFPNFRIGQSTNYAISAVIDRDGEIVHIPQLSNEAQSARSKQPELPDSSILRFEHWDRPEPPCVPGKRAAPAIPNHENQ